MITKDQVYRRYNSTKGIVHRIRVVEYAPGSNRARVVDAYTGKRPREILVSSLHQTAGRNGEPRRTGYTLEAP